MHECCGRVIQPDEPWTVAILDDNSVYFAAIGRVMVALGWPIDRIAIEPGTIAALIEWLRQDNPRLILIGSWLGNRAISPLIERLLCAELPGSLLVVHDGNDLGGNRMLVEAIKGHKPLINCTTAALDSFLRVAGAKPIPAPPLISRTQRVPAVSARRRESDSVRSSPISPASPGRS